MVFQRLRHRALPTHAPVMVKRTTKVGLMCTFSDENVDLKDENNQSKEGVNATQKRRS